MSLFIRLVRALFVFNLIFMSYMVQLGLARVFRTWRKDGKGNEEPVLPAWLARRRARVDMRNARRLLRTMLKLRGVYIKLGQVLSIMGGFLPRAYTSELESLQDSVPPQSFDYVEDTFIRSLGKKPDECFTSIERIPLAAASLGQVHLAYLKDGTKVAVKILYPQIRDIIRVDMRVVRMGLTVYKKFFPFGGIERVHDALVDLLRRETDYIHEASCMKRMADNFADEPDLLFPAVISEFTTRDILTMTFMEGIKITKFEDYEKLGIDRVAVASRLVRSFYKQLFIDRFFHADPHPGNFLVQPGPTPEEPRLVFLDFGAISEVRTELVEGLTDILQGIFVEDSSLALVGFRRMGFVAEEGNKELLERTVMTYFGKLLKIQDRTPGALMRAKQHELESLADPEVARMELRELMRSFQYPDGWFYAERASVMMFWLCAQIAPDLDTLQVGFPYIVPLILKRQQEMTAALEASP
ncbi:MAG: AarF/ABC1/UbiB kinase family protein [Sandaracinaceae bacterium]|nr:AarF/ABC1/UbiB kinase family protein [Sandaracinaceae bacterium]